MSPYTSCISSGPSFRVLRQPLLLPGAIRSVNLSPEFRNMGLQENCHVGTRLADPKDHTHFKFVARSPATRFGIHVLRVIEGDRNLIENHFELVRRLRIFVELHGYACERDTCYDTRTSAARYGTDCL